MSWSLVWTRKWHVRISPGVTQAGTHTKGASPCLLLRVASTTKRGVQAATPSTSHKVFWRSGVGHLTSERAALHHVFYRGEAKSAPLHNKQQNNTRQNKTTNQKQIVPNRQFVNKTLNKERWANIF